RLILQNFIFSCKFVLLKYVMHSLARIMMKVKIVFILVAGYFTQAIFGQILDSDNFKNNYHIDNQYNLAVYPKKDTSNNEGYFDIQRIRNKSNINHRTSFNTHIELDGNFNHKRTVDTKNIMPLNITDTIRYKTFYMNENKENNYLHELRRNDNKIKLRKKLIDEYLIPAENYDKTTKRNNTNVNPFAHKFTILSKRNKYDLREIGTIKNRMMRRANEHRNKNLSFQSLCPTKRISVLLETTEYEYRPKHYTEVICSNNFLPIHRNFDTKNKICSEAGFSCMQLNRTIHLIRRNKSALNECWESEIRVVPSGCECMWPKHYYGDILAYHESEKRFNPGLNTAHIPHLSIEN
ncbi:hypothetical protein DOY81_008489, partial [Sarcophaga bullata]